MGKYGKKDSDLVPLGALWSKESKAGEWYGSGSFSKDAFEGVDLEHFHANLNDYRLTVFTTPKKWKKEGSPDFKIYISSKDQSTQSKGEAFKKTLKSAPVAKAVVEQAAEAPATNRLPWED